MNESLRWKLILGCLVIAALEAPHTSLVLVEDLGGPYSIGIDRPVNVPMDGAASARGAARGEVARAQQYEDRSEKELVADRNLRGRASR